MAGIEAEAEHKALLNCAIQQHLITPANIFILAPTQLDISRGSTFQVAQRGLIPALLSLTSLILGLLASGKKTVAFASNTEKLCLDLFPKLTFMPATVVKRTALLFHHDLESLRFTSLLNLSCTTGSSSVLPSLFTHHSSARKRVPSKHLQI